VVKSGRMWFEVGILCIFLPFEKRSVRRVILRVLGRNDGIMERWNNGEEDIIVVQTPIFQYSNIPIKPSTRNQSFNPSKKQKHENVIIHRRLWL
jgi:hypothetical protein